MSIEQCPILVIYKIKDIFATNIIDSKSKGKIRHPKVIPL